MSRAELIAGLKMEKNMIESLIKEIQSKEYCKCEILRFTNPYANSYQCVDCKRIFIVEKNDKILKTARINKGMS